MTLSRILALLRVSRGRSPDAGHVASQPWVDIRRLLLSTAPSRLELAPTRELPRVWAAVLEHGRQGEGTGAAVAVADGSVSLYTTVGGAIVGAGADPRTRAVALTFLRAVEASLDRVPIAVDLPLAGAGEWALIALTHGGTRHRAARTLDAIARADDPLHAAFNSGRELVIAISALDSKAHGDVRQSPSSEF